MSKFRLLFGYFFRLFSTPVNRLIGLDQVPASFRTTIQLAQIDSRARLSVKMAVVGETVLLAFASGFIGTPGMIQFYGFVLIVSLCYGTLVWLGHTWQKTIRKTEIFSAFQRGYCILQFLLGASWSGVIASALPHADATQIAQIYAIMIGLVSTAVFTGPALYSLLFWTPLVIGTIFSLLLPSANTAPATFIGIVVYDVLTFLAIIELNQKLIEREIGALRIARLKDEAEVLLRDFQQGASDWLFELDHNLVIVNPSRRFCEVAHRTGTSMQIAFETLLRNGDCSVARRGDDGISELMAFLANRTSFRDVVVSIPLQDELRWWDLSGKPIFHRDGSFAGYSGVGRDVTELHRSQERISYLAHHDSLTSLRNRDIFSTTLRRATYSDTIRNAAVLCVDFDHFKSINDSFGHSVGDHLLRAASDRLSSCVRDRDMVFRLGGDEFAIILPDIQHFETALIAQRIVDNIAQPFRVNDLIITIGASVGIAVLPTDADTPEGIHHCADLALYQAKADGRGRFCFFDRDVENSISRRIMIHTALKNAVTTCDEFFVEYQPIVDLRSRTLVSMEALVRWRHPIHGIINPAEFIPAAEDSCLIRPIGTHVINIAFRTAARLANNVAVALNLSPRQLSDETLLDTIAEALDRNELPGSRIEFEITETTFLEASRHNLDLLDRIRDLGCRIVLDDFGSGYSSFPSLGAFGFDRLKITQSLLHNVSHNPKRRIILGSIVTMGLQIGIDVVAEGIETQQQLDLLRSLDCPMGQGFLFSPPVSDTLAIREYGINRPEPDRITSDCP